MAIRPNPVPVQDPRYPERSFAFDGACKIPAAGSNLKWPPAPPPPPPPPKE